MEGIIALILMFCYIGITLYGYQLRKELSKTVYWKSLPKGVAVFGYSLPILIFLILNSEKIGFFRIFLSILLAGVFLYSVIKQNNMLRKKTLKGFPSVMPDEVRRKVTTFHALTPLLTIFVLFYIGIILSFIFGVSDYMKGSRKNKR